jgi:hypothetical protein
MIENLLDQLRQLWLFKVAVLWAAIDIVVIMTGWYAVRVVKRRFPNWWKRTIVDTAPPELDELVDEAMAGETTQPSAGQARTLGTGTK